MALNAGANLNVTLGAEVLAGTSFTAVAGGSIIVSGASTITGRFGYSGGAGCPVKDVVMTGYFYGREGASVGEALWRSSWSGATRVTPGHQLPLEAYGMVAGRAASARLSIAKVVCA